MPEFARPGEQVRPAPDRTSVAVRRMRHRSAASGLAMIGVLLLAAATARAETLDDAAERYRPFMAKDIDAALAGAQALRQRVAANDVEGAQKAWIEARTGWEHAEVFTSGFVAELDEEIDAWPNALTGFHAIEAKLFGARSADVGPETDRLIYYLSDLDVKIHHTPLNAQGLLTGAARLAYEVGESKADGGESRFSGTSLADMRNNVAGIALVYQTCFAPALEARDAKLAASARTRLDRLQGLLGATELKAIDPDRLRAASEDLVVTLQAAAPVLGLIKPTLEELSQ